MTVLVCGAWVFAANPAPFENIQQLPSNGAAGWEYFQINEKHYLASANFFTSSPGRQASVKTRSTVFQIEHLSNDRLHLKKVQDIATSGAHGVEYFQYREESYIAIPNYYGKDSIILRWNSKKEQFVEIQRIASDGGGSIESFLLPNGKLIVGIAEFNKGIASLYVLEGVAPNEQFQPWQKVEAPGVGALATVHVDNGRLLMLASCYVSQQFGWHTRSKVFYFDGNAFKVHHDIKTVGAHDVETISIHGRHFAFFSNDKDSESTFQNSELFEWVAGKSLSKGRFVSRQKVFSNGAHAAEFFVDSNSGRYFLAVANLGDRKLNKYRTDSRIYAFDPQHAKLKLIQKVPTLGATDIEGFSISGSTYFIVANEQDDELGGDISSTLWRLAQTSSIISPGVDEPVGEL